MALNMCNTTLYAHYLSYTMYALKKVRRADISYVWQYIHYVSTHLYNTQLIQTPFEAIFVSGVLCQSRIKQTSMKKVLGELSEYKSKHCYLHCLSGYHWSKSFVCCTVICQETSKGPEKIMIAALIMIGTVANLYFYFTKSPATFCVC